MDRVSVPHPWYPKSLVRQAAHRPLGAFAAGLNARFLLVVVLDADASELALGLRAPDPQRAGEDVSFVTREAALNTSSHASAPAERPSLASPQTDRLPPELLRQPCHVVPIAKRDPDSFLKHVSVGRARNHDIVLRHNSVSKFHGWFELPDDGRLFVKDCDSSNHILVDGQRVNQRSEVQPGQTVSFGLVECRVCSPQSIWAVLQR